MQIRFVKTLVLVACLSLAVLNTSCGKEAVTGGFSSPSLGDDDDDTNAPGNARGFYISMSKPAWPMDSFLHQFYDPSSECNVLSSATGSNANVQCLLNVREADLYYSDIAWEFNAPPGMCAYIRETPFYYYNNQPGKGPTTISVTQNASNVITSCSSEAGAGSVTNGVCTLTEATVDSSGAPKCDYDYSDLNMRNCCEGEFTTTVITPTGTNVTKGKWGGSYGNCATSVIERNGWQRIAKSYNTPATMVYDGISGVNKKFSMPKAIGAVVGWSNISVSNFYGWAEYRAGNHASAPLPLAFRDRNDKSGTVIPLKPSPAYTYDCMNQSNDRIASIRVYINEWNTSDQFLAYKGGSLTASPNVRGVEGTACNNDGVGGQDCDDFEDWDGRTDAASPTLYDDEYPMWELQ